MSRRRRTGPFDPDADIADPQAVSAGLSAIVGRKQWAARLEGARIFALWTEIAGAALAAHVEPVRLVNGVLVVRADSAVWATQVRYLAADLTDRANAVLGQGAVQQVTVLAGGARPGKATAH